MKTRFVDKGIPVVVGEYGEAGDRTGIAVVEPVVVGEQALGEGGIVLALDEWAC